MAHVSHNFSCPWENLLINILLELAFKFDLKLSYAFFVIKFFSLNTVCFQIVNCVELYQQYTSCDLEALSGDLQVQNHFYNNTNILFAFFIHILY